MSPLRRYLLFLAVVVALTLLLLAAGYAPTRAAGGAAALLAMVLACAVSFTGSVLGALPIALARVGGTQGLQLFMVSMLLRLLLVGLLAAAVVVAVAPPRDPFLIWLALSYLVLLVADTGYALTALRSL